MNGIIAGNLNIQLRVRNGRRREGQIAEALKIQHKLNLVEPTEHEDKYRKIDRWLVEGTKRTAVQIKYRESGDDLLVEVFDRWHGWDSPRNKVGRDLEGDSKLYCVLRTDQRTVILTSADVLKQIANEMIQHARLVGWTRDFGPERKSLKFAKAGGVCELKVQNDPYDHRPKMVAYIPVSVVTSEYQAKKYLVALPANWKE